MAPGPKWKPILDAQSQFRRSVEAHPLARTFIAWSDWGRDYHRSEKQFDRHREGIAELWCDKLPSDITPRLLLAELAEKRNALTFALKHLTQAERIDPSHPGVRLGRLRLTFATLWRHFKDRKPHLVDRDLDELAALPAMGEGDRPAFMSALRVAAAVLAGDADRVQRFAAETAARLQSNPLIAPRFMVIATSLAGVSHLPHNQLIPPDAVDTSDARLIADVVARFDACFKAIGISAGMPRHWAPILREALTVRPCIFNPATLLSIGAVYAIRDNPRDVAYLASAAGLESAQGVMAARFLLVRGCLMADSVSFRRAVQCLDAAAWLASAGGDAELAKQIAAVRRSVGRPARRSPDPSRLEKVVEAERAATSYPKSPDEVLAPLVPLYPAEDSASSFDDETDDWDDDPGIDPIDDPDPNDDDGTIELMPGFSVPASILRRPEARELIVRVREAIARGSDVPAIIRDQPELVADLLIALNGMDPAYAPTTMRKAILEMVKKDGNAMLRGGLSPEGKRTRR